MKYFNLVSIILVVLFTTCKEQTNNNTAETLIANGQMPNAVSDGYNLNIVYGSSDSILYINSSDGGQTFSSPELIAVLPQLAASHMRGPQITGSDGNLTVIACTKPGDIHSYTKRGSEQWQVGKKVNDIDTVSKEGLMALHSDGLNTFAVWLDLRDHHNKIYGARSINGGVTWAENQLIYASPDTTVCECCKPSVVVKGQHVSIMFRNWLSGNRDLYLIQSSDGGVTFGAAQKLGNGNWALNGCPMDGGGIALRNNNSIQTVWHRQGKIYSCEPGQEEKEIGTGKNCAVAIVNNKPIYAWTENGEIIVLLPDKERLKIAKGRYPVIKAISNDKFACIWQDEKQIRAQVINL